MPRIYTTPLCWRPIDETPDDDHITAVMAFIDDTDGLDNIGAVLCDGIYHWDGMHWKAERDGDDAPAPTHWMPESDLVAAIDASLAGMTSNAIASHAEMVGRN